MGHPPSRKEVKKWLTKLCARIDRHECHTCDCFQGFVMQLRLDADENMDDLFQPLEVSTDQMHPCLGCSPCPPGEIYSQYILAQEGKGGKNKSRE